MMMTKNETIALIIESIVNEGYKSADDFVTYCTMILPMMSTEELQAEYGRVTGRVELFGVIENDDI
jgi:hypothetical protein